MSRIIIINGSPRKNGVDSSVASLISEEFAKDGNVTEIVNICEKNIHGCIGCMSCRKTGTCVQKDDVQDIIAKMRDSDMLILMSPIYFGGETGQMKTFTDRLTSAFSGERPMGSVRVAKILLTCADKNGDKIYDPTLKRMDDMMKYLKIEQHDGAIIGGLSPETVKDSPAVKEFIEDLRQRL